MRPKQLIMQLTRRFFQDQQLLREVVGWQAALAWVRHKLTFRKEHLVKYQFQFPTTRYALLAPGKLPVTLRWCIRS